MRKKIIYKNDKLCIPKNPEVKLELIPVSKTKILINGFLPEVSYTFIFDDNNEVEKHRIQQKETGLVKIAIRKSN